MTSTQVYLTNLLHCSLQAESLVGHDGHRNKLNKEFNNIHQQALLTSINVFCPRFLYDRVITRVNALLSNLLTVANLPLVINSVVKLNIRFFSPPTPHHSFSLQTPVLSVVRFVMLCVGGYKFWICGLRSLKCSDS